MSGFFPSGLDLIELSSLKKIGLYNEISDSKIYNIRIMYFPEETYLYQKPKEEKIDLIKEKKKKLYILYYGYPHYDYCKLFGLEDVIEEKRTFNRDYNTKEFRWILWIRYNLSRDPIDTIVKRVKNETNVIIVIFGTPNSGKSEVAQSLAIFIVNVFKRLRGKEVNLKVAFNDPEFSLIIKDMEDGDVTIRDETPKLAGTGSKNIKKNIDNITAIIRLAQNSFIFVNPVVIEPLIVTFYIEMAGKYKDERICRCILYDKNKNPIGHIFVPLHNDKEFRDEYLIKKRKNIKSLKAFSGLVGVEVDMKRLKIDIKNLYGWCREKEIFFKGEIGVGIDFYNDEVEDIKKIKGDTNYIEKVINMTWGEIKRAKEGKKCILYEEVIEESVKEEVEIIEIIKEEIKDKEEKEEVDLVLKEVIREEEILDYDNENYFIEDYQFIEDDKILHDLMRKKNKESYKKADIEKLISVYQLKEANIPVEEIVDKIESLKEKQSVYSALNRYYSHKSKVKGDHFEIQYEKYLKDKLEPLDWHVERIGGSSKPDIIAQKDNVMLVFSLKNDKKYTYYRKELQGEISYINDNLSSYPNTHLYLVVFDYKSIQTIIKKIDYFSFDRVTINFN